MTELKKLEISKIGYDPQYYPRVNGEDDWQTRLQYADALRSHPSKANPKNKGAFPPIVVVRARHEIKVKDKIYVWPYWMLDGLHRHQAFHVAGYKYIWANVERIPRSKWLETSTALNIAGKRGLSAMDKRWVATRLKSDGFSLEKISGLLEMEKASFERLMATGIQKIKQPDHYRKPSAADREIDGEHYGFLKAPFKGTTGTRNAEVALDQQGTTSSQNARQIMQSFLALLSSKCIDLGDPETERLLADIYKQLRGYLKK